MIRKDRSILLTAMCTCPPSFLQKYASIISGFTLIIFLIASTIFTAIPSISEAILRSPPFKNSKRVPLLVVLDKKDLMQIDATAT